MKLSLYNWKVAKKKKKANSSFAPDICSHEPTFVKTDINSSWSPVIDNNFIKKVPYHSHFQANTAAALFTDCLKAVLDPVSFFMLLPQKNTVCSDWSTLAGLSFFLASIPALLL